MTKYEWQSPTTKLLRILRASLAVKKRAKWARDIGAGFIREDIKDVCLANRNTIRVELDGLLRIDAVPPDFNLRETEELIKFLEEKNNKG